MHVGHKGTAVRLKVSCYSWDLGRYRFEWNEYIVENKRALGVALNTLYRALVHPIANVG
jgi:hypothetical protein